MPNALADGATREDLLGVLRAVAPQVGGPKMVAAAPELMLAMGLPCPTTRSSGMPFMRRRPLLRAAAVGGGAYMAGSPGSAGHSESDQDSRSPISSRSEARPPAPPACRPLLPRRRHPRVAGPATTLFAKLTQLGAVA